MNRYRTYERVLKGGKGAAETDKIEKSGKGHNERVLLTAGIKRKRETRIQETRCQKRGVTRKGEREGGKRGKMGQFHRCDQQAHTADALSSQGNGKQAPKQYEVRHSETQERCEDRRGSVKHA